MKRPSGRRRRRSICPIAREAGVWNGLQRSWTVEVQVLEFRRRFFSLMVGLLIRVFRSEIILLLHETLTVYNY